MKIISFILAITGISNIIVGYLVATDKIKPSKQIQVINYIIIGILLFGNALHAFFE